MGGCSNNFLRAISRHRSSSDPSSSTQGLASTISSPFYYYYIVWWSPKQSCCFFFLLCVFPSSGLLSIHVLLIWHLTTYINQMSVWIKSDAYQFCDTEEEKNSEFVNSWWSHKHWNAFVQKKVTQTTTPIDLRMTYLFEWIMELQHLFMAFCDHRR